MENSADIVRTIKSVWARVDAAGREPYPEERQDLANLNERAKSAMLMEKLSGPGNTFTDGRMSQGGGGSPGEQFVKSDGYKRIASSGSRGQQWTSGNIDVGMSMKGTLLEGPGSPGTGSGGGLLPTPQVIPGIVGKTFQPLTIESLLLGGQASGNQVRYAIQGTATSGAAGVAEGGTKPESTLGFGVADEPIKKVATSIQISDELIEDAPAISSFINGQLSLFVSIEVERQLFRGTSGGNEVQGLLTSRGVPVYSVATGGTASLVADNLFKAMNGVRGSAFVEPEWIVLHPQDWQTLRLGKDTAGQYFGGGPFQGPYGNGQNVQASGQLIGADSLWSKQVYVTSAIGGAGTALVGSSAAAQVWSRGGLVVEATNSHGGNFVLDITAIRAERRLGLCVYRPGALVEVRF